MCVCVCVCLCVCVCVCVCARVCVCVRGEEARDRQERDVLEVHAERLLVVYAPVCVRVCV